MHSEVPNTYNLKRGIHRKLLIIKQMRGTLGIFMNGIFMNEVVVYKRYIVSEMNTILLRVRN